MSSCARGPVEEAVGVEWYVSGSDDELNLPTRWPSEWPRTLATIRRA
jgi:hypothetical protein